MINYNYNVRYSKFCDFLFNEEYPDLLNISYHNITHFISCGKIALHICAAWINLKFWLFNTEQQSSLTAKLSSHLESFCLNNIWMISNVWVQGKL